MKRQYFLLPVLLSICMTAFAQNGTKLPKVTTVNGVVGRVVDSGLDVFMGIPFAQRSVGELRWKEPQPVTNWSGIYKADHFRAKAMQKNVFGDMVFRADGTNEDCLYLNVWTPATSAKAKLPVL